MSQIVYLSSDGRRTSYRVSDHRGWMEFDLWPNGEVASHVGRPWRGVGSLWPHDFPGVFEVARWRTLVRADVTLPEYDPENTWASYRGMTA